MATLQLDDKIHDNSLKIHEGLNWAPDCYQGPDLGFYRRARDSQTPEIFFRNSCVFAAILRYFKGDPVAKMGHVPPVPHLFESLPGLATIFGVSCGRHCTHSLINNPKQKPPNSPHHASRPNPLDIWEITDYRNYRNWSNCPRFRKWGGPNHSQVQYSHSCVYWGRPDRTEKELARRLDPLHRPALIRARYNPRHIVRFFIWHHPWFRNSYPTWSPFGRL